MSKCNYFISSWDNYLLKSFKLIDIAIEVACYYEFLKSHCVDNNEKYILTVNNRKR